MVLGRTSTILTLFLYNFNFNAVDSKDLNYSIGPVVNTNVGPIRGLKADDGDYYMFMGIPYAEVDKNNVFGPATSYPKFNSTFDAFDDSSRCPQREEYNMTLIGTLDCLNLHVYVPNSASATNKVPVFVWIFGGTFTFSFPGRFLYGPKFIVKRDIILVMINYRLGPYGFMCLDIPEVSGNQGLKDQIMALRWIKNNIEAFGGDTTRITVGGLSSGGMSVDLHLYYGKEKLFHRMMPQGGVAITNRVVRYPNPKVPFIMAEYFNYAPRDVLDALSFLTSLHPHEIIAATEKLQLSFKPCLEKDFGNASYITEHPVNIQTLKVKDIDILMGFSNDEAYAIYAPMENDGFAVMDFVGTAICADFDFDDDDKLLTEMRGFVKNFYFGDDEINPNSRRPVINLVSDFNYYHSTLRAVKKYLDNGVKALYFFMFTYKGGMNFYSDFNKVTGGGASHADELGYLFDVSYMKGPHSPKDALIVDRMTELWANFVKHGNPTPQVSELIPLQWPPVTPNNWRYMRLDLNLSIASRPFHDRMAFLDLFYKKYEHNQRYTRRRQPFRGTNIVLDINLPLLFAIKYFL